MITGTAASTATFFAFPRPFFAISKAALFFCLIAAPQTVHDYVDTIIENLDGEKVTSEYVIRMNAIDYIEKHNTDKTGKEETDNGTAEKQP